MDLHVEWTAYGFNNRPGRGPPHSDIVTQMKRINTQVVKRPDWLFLIGDYTEVRQYWGPAMAWTISQIWSDLHPELKPRHFNKGNLICHDGHLESYTWAELPLETGWVKTQLGRAPWWDTWERTPFVGADYGWPP